MCTVTEEPASSKAGAGYSQDLPLSTFSARGNYHPHSQLRQRRNRETKEFHLVVWLVRKEFRPAVERGKEEASSAESGPGIALQRLLQELTSAKTIDK